jgi:hypothetical protein
MPRSLADLVVIAIPFKRSFKDPWQYHRQIQTILAATDDTSRLILCSSTSVYPMENQIASEEDELTPHNERAKVLLAVEALILERDGVVIRLGGLIGPNRDPAKFLAAKGLIDGADIPVNLIHLDDALGILEFCIENRLASEIINAVHPAHPSKADFYTRVAQQSAQSAPQFSDQRQIPYKEVSAARIQALGYAFKRPALY